jgi:hypothetical protein
MPSLRRAAQPFLAATLMLGASQIAAATAVCEARSGATPPTVVELYTSEGCSSCPPADRWLSTVTGKDGVLALAFHVDYWDRLGWKDRFANAQYTARQYALQRVSGARFVYTPQVVVNGRDWRGWPGALPAPASAEAPAVAVIRTGDTFTATVGALTGDRVQTLAGYWAITENGHQTTVKAGENSGSTLHHDAVVRHYATVAAWPGNKPQTLTFAPPASASASGRQIIFVVTRDGDPQPLQAVSIGC